MALGPQNESGLVSFPPEIDNSVNVYIEIFCVACNMRIACFQRRMTPINKRLHAYKLTWVAEMANSCVCVCVCVLVFVCARACVGVCWAATFYLAKAVGNILWLIYHSK